MKLRRELEPDPTQYGGVRGCGVEHMLLDMWEMVLGSMEGGKSAAVLLGVDYEKAFNRMEHAECLRQLRDLEASDGSISLARAFLEERAMTITINGHKASPVKIERGSPQGSTLGCLLYCITTQQLTKNLRGDHAPVRFFPQTSSDEDDDDFWNPGGMRAVANGPSAFMYVDDTTLFDRQEVGTASLHLTTGPAVANFEDLQLAGDLAELSGRAKEIGMKINEKKTQLLIIGPPNGYLHAGSLEGPEGETITSVDTMILVGFTFGSTPGVGAHVGVIVERFRRKVWMLYHLRDSGFKGRQLYRLYCCYVRTIIEYCSVVHHPMLGAGLEADLEGLHCLAIKICFGFHIPVYMYMRENGIKTLKARRIRRCDPKFAHWFSPREGVRRNLRKRREIQETRSSTNIQKDSTRPLSTFEEGRMSLDSASLVLDRRLETRRRPETS